MNEYSYKLFFKALSNQTRFRIVELLRNGPKTVGEICDSLGYEQSRVSHNLKCLVNCGFLSFEIAGKSRRYRLNDGISAILDGIDSHIKKYEKDISGCDVIL